MMNIGFNTKLARAGSRDHQTLRSVLLLAATVLLFAANAASVAAQTTIKLKNGKSFTGKVVAENANFITLETDGKRVRILRSIVVSIDGAAPEATEKPSGAASSETSKPAAATQPESSNEQSSPPRPSSSEASADNSGAGSEEVVVRLKNGAVLRGPLINDKGNFAVISVKGKPVKVLKTVIVEMDGKPYQAEASGMQAQAQAEPESSATQPSVQKPPEKPKDGSATQTQPPSGPAAGTKAGSSGSEKSGEPAPKAVKSESKDSEGKEDDVASPSATLAGTPQSDPISEKKQAKEPAARVDAEKGTQARPPTRTPSTTAKTAAPSGTPPPPAKEPAAKAAQTSQSTGETAEKAPSKSAADAAKTSADAKGTSKKAEPSAASEDEQAKPSAPAETSSTRAARQQERGGTAAGDGAGKGESSTTSAPAAGSLDSASPTVEAEEKTKKGTKDGQRKQQPKAQSKSASKARSRPPVQAKPASIPPPEKKPDGGAKPGPQPEGEGAEAAQGGSESAATGEAVGRQPPGVTAVDTVPPIQFSKGVPDELKPLVDQLSASDPIEQIFAAFELRKMGKRAIPATPYLLRRLRNTMLVELSRRDRRKLGEDIDRLSPAKAAAMSLASIGKPIVGNLNRALHHDEAPVRAGAAWVLGEIKHSSSVGPLLAKVKDPNGTVRGMAAIALGKIRDPRAIPLLVTMMAEDNTEETRKMAEWALRRLTEVPLLIKGLRDESTFVQDNAAYILWLMTAKEFRKDVQAWERWWREQEASNSGQAEDAAAKTSQ